MKYLIIKCGIIALNIIYFFIKIFPVQKNKVTFLSRQGNNVSIDFKLLIDELKKEKKDIKITVLCKELNNGITNKIKYFFYIFKQMYHIATSKICILDGYCIPICILKQKKQLVTIQIWHALGSLKKFGYSSINLEGGRDSKIAKIMRMHKNYTYILTSSNLSKEFFKEAFHAEDRQMKIMNLPRVDFLQSEELKKSTIKSILKIYPELNNKKKNILYCPTQRKNTLLPLEEMVKQIDSSKYNFIAKLHFGKEIVFVENKTIERESSFTGLELLHIADYIITDYSAIVFEAVITKKPIYFYDFDYDTYMKERGIYINYREEMPGPIEKEFKRIIQLIDQNYYDKNKINHFCNKYIENTEKNATKELTKLILKNMNN